MSLYRHRTSTWNGNLFKSIDFVIGFWFFMIVKNDCVQISPKLLTYLNSLFYSCSHLHSKTLNNKIIYKIYIVPYITYKKVTLRC